MIQEVKMETGKGTIAVGGTIASALTLNELVMYATLIYIVIQAILLIRKHYCFEKDRRKAKDTP